MSLFWKIFLWFWGAMVLIGLGLYFVVLTTRPDPTPAPWREATRNTLAVAGRSAARAWENSGQQALRLVLDETSSQTRGQFWLFDSEGHELSGHSFPPRGPNQPHPNDSPPGDDEHHNPVFEDLTRRALDDDAPAFDAGGPRVLAALPIEGTQNRRYVILAGLAHPSVGRPAAAPQVQFLGGLGVLALSGLVCFGLVRYLTAPLIGLREATHRLAAGDLTARSGAQKSARRDEVADLGRDFDSMAERIQALVGAQQQILADISHELRSPLARLNMALALSKRHGAQNEALQSNLERIGRESKRLDALIGQLLELARLQDGDGARRTRLDLKKLLGEVMADADFEAKSSGHTIRLVAPASRLVSGDAGLLHSALENVVRNALRHSPPGGEIEIRLEDGTLKGAPIAALRVLDRGPGVPEAELKTIFSPFYRVEAARDRQSGGVGLGLSIVERAIRAHNGEVCARNREGGGLEIVIALPVL